MNKKILILSILAAVLMIMLPLSSVVGTNVVKSNYQENVGSPLFAIRHRSKNTIQSEYLGKERPLNLFLAKRTSLQAYADKALKMIEARPNLLKSIMSSIVQMPEIEDLLEQYDMDMVDFKNQMNLVINDPVLLDESINEAVLLSPFGDDPMPLGLSTSSVIGCFIIALIMIPIFALIGMIIATITIITCLNIKGCFETIVQNLVDSFIQGLTPPDY
jgi:hypothetical protein